MKETGLICQAESVKAILDDLKTMTRRVMNPQPVTDPKLRWWHWGKVESTSLDFKAVMPLYCPYGGVGDRLWAKETWATEKRLDHLSGRELGNAGDVALWYRATEIPSVALDRGRWRSSRFMPRWASRILLEITEVRVQRIQEISLQDMWAEGMDRDMYAPTQFELLWDKLNKKRGYSWLVNPWVWCISFRRLRDGADKTSGGG